MLKAVALVVLVLGALAAGVYSWQVAEYQKGIRVEQLGWMLPPDASLSPDSRGIDVLFIEPDCGYQGKLSTKIEYRPTEIALGLRLEFEPGCMMGGGTAHAHFDLAEPLGNRAVVPLDQLNLTPADFVRPQAPTIDPAFGNDPRL